MNEYVLHAQHNEKFHEKLCEQFPDSYFDWKVTALFYISCHYLLALAKNRGIDLGDSHAEINSNIRPGGHNAKMPISKTAFNNYMNLFRYSQTSRYDGVVPDLATFEQLRKADHAHALKCLSDFKKYVNSFGVAIAPAM